MQNVLIIGAGGQLGRELSRIYNNSFKLFHANSGTENIDISNEEDLENRIRNIDPDIIINASALANVDRCEKERDYALMVNGLSVRTMVRCARSLNVPFIHVSTDYVFDGIEGSYSENSSPNPINYYGLSKLVGDIYSNSYEGSLIVRTSGVYGYTNNFPKFVYNALKDGKQVNAIPGFYSPIHARNLAVAISDLVNNNTRGIINVAGERVSRIALAKHIADFFELPEDLISESSEIKSMIARRPFDSSLNIDRAKSLLKTDFFSIRSNLEHFRETVST